MLVKVYSTPTCPACDMVKTFLTRNKIKFEAIDVGSDEEKRDEMIDKSGQFGVPVTIISDGEEKIIVGYNPMALKKALRL